MKKNLTGIAKGLRNNLTEAEKFLWYELRVKNLGVKFRRQVVIGQYIVDFVCFEKKLVVEVDGGQHSQNQKDIERDAWFHSQGFKVLRFWNNDVFENRDGVLETIEKQVKFPLPIPPHKVEGKRGRFSWRFNSPFLVGAIFLTGAIPLPWWEGLGEGEKEENQCAELKHLL